MKNKLLILACITLLHFTLKAQMKVGNNPTAINSASLLELESTNKGFVFPRLALTSLSSPGPLPAGLLTGTVVFNTATGVGSGIGLYYWSGTAWVAVTSSGSGSGWLITGNNNTNATNFLGTTDINAPLIFKVGGVQAGYLGISSSQVTTFGTGATGGGQQSTAIGADAVAQQQAVAVGYNAQATQQAAIAIGNTASATTNAGLAIGAGASASSQFGIAIGSGSQATSNPNTLSVGSLSRATGQNATAIGNGAQALADNSIVLGTLSTVPSQFPNTILIGSNLTAAQSDALILGNSAKKIGMGTTTPQEKLDVVGNVRFSGALMPNGIAGAAGQVLTSAGAGAAPTWQPSVSGGGAWSLTGNAGTSYATNFIGTTDNVGFRVRTNNLQRILVDSLGDVAIGSTAFNPNNRERLLVDYGTTTSNTLANFRGGINDYFQLNIQNTSGGNKASSDYVATADDGTDTSFFVDMGINGSHYAQNPENWGNKHDAYLYSKSKNLLIGTQADSSDLYFLLGGGQIKANTALQIKGPSGVIVVGKGDLTDSPTGNIIRGPNASATVPNTAGGSLTVTGGNASGTATGGDLNLHGGNSVSGERGAVNITGQDIKAKLGTDGKFLIVNNGTPGVNEFIKLLIRESGEVNWYLDGQDLFMRDGFFNAFGNGTLYKYDFMHIDGTNGRIGFNILNGYSDGSPGGENNLPLTSSVTLQGSIATKVRILDAATNYVIQQDDHILIIDKTTNTNSDMILSPVATSKGREYIFKRNDNGTGKIIVKPAPGEKLNGIVDGTVTLGADNSTLEVVCGPDSWWITSEISITQTAQVTTTSITASDKNLIEVNFTSTGQRIDINLPAAADKEDKTYVIKRNANGAVYPGNVLRIVPASGENLDQSSLASPYIMENVFQSVTVRSNGTRWVILNNYNAEDAVVAVTTAYTPYKNDKTILADASSASFTVTLPGAATVEKGKTYTVKRTNAGANTVIVDGNGSETMDGIASLRLNQRFDYLQLQSDGANWMIISERISPSLVVNPALPYAATVYDGTISSNGSGTINLPSAAAVLGGKIFTIKNSATAGNPTLTVDPNGSETVDGLATWPLTKGQFVTIQSDGTNWIVIGQ